MFNESNVHLGLYVIDQKKPATEFLKRGLEYSQIADLINKLLVQDFIKLEGDKFILTEQGRHELNVARAKLLKGNFLAPDHLQKVEPMPQDFVYVPKREIIKKL